VHRDLLKKEAWERTKKPTIFQQGFKPIFKSVFNEVLTIITLQTKNMNTVWE